jgi:hypothetical protein
MEMIMIKINGGAFGYLDQPAAIGVDFFQGPFQDSDGEDNQME